MKKVYTPSKFSELMFTAKGRRFSLADRPWWRSIYNIKHPDIIVMGGRQIEKSTFIGNRLTSEACMERLNYIYGSATYNHVKRFFRDRLTDTLFGSKTMRKFFLSGSQVSVSQSMIRLSNLSSIDLVTLRGNGDTVRGIPGDRLYIDEMQDITTTSVQVAKECLFKAIGGGITLYTGTPKTLENNLAKAYYGKSTQEEWMVQCDLCGKYNILGLKNISPKGIICHHCYKASKKHHVIDVRTGRWIAMTQLGTKKYMRGFRMPQLLVAGIMDPDSYYQFYLKVVNTDPVTLYNEILGLPYNTSEVPLRESDFVCMDDMMVPPEQVQKKYPVAPKFFGIDWGLGLGSFTILSIGAIVEGKLRLIYMKRYEKGKELNPQWQLQDIKEKLRMFRWVAGGVDWGVGRGYQNPSLQKEFGRDRVFEFYNSGIQTAAVKYNKKHRYYTIDRDGQLGDMFAEIKDGILLFPNKNQSLPFIKDFLNIRTEYREDKHGDTEAYYTHDEDSPDDSAHSVNYLRVAAIIKRKW